MTLTKYKSKRNFNGKNKTTELRGKLDKSKHLIMLNNTK